MFPLLFVHNENRGDSRLHREMTLLWMVQVRPSTSVKKVYNPNADQ